MRGIIAAFIGWSKVQNKFSPHLRRCLCLPFEIRGSPRRDDRMGDYMLRNGRLSLGGVSQQICVAMPVA